MADFNFDFESLDLLYGLNDSKTPFVEKADSKTEEDIFNQWDYEEKKYRNDPALSQSDFKIYYKYGVDNFIAYLKDKSIFKIPYLENILEEGTFYHMYLLQNELVNIVYEPVEKSIINSSNKEEFIKLVAGGMDPILATKNCYKLKTDRDILKKSQELMEELKDYIDVYKLKSYKLQISPYCFYIAEEFLKNYKNLDIFKQYNFDQRLVEYPIFSNIDGLAIKGKLDEIYISREEQVILINDLKTCKFSHPNMFIKDIIEYDYLYQQAFYKMLFLNNFDEYKDYKIINTLTTLQKNKPHTVHNIILDEDIINEKIEIIKKDLQNFDKSILQINNLQINQHETGSFKYSDFINLQKSKT